MILLKPIGLWKKYSFTARVSSISNIGRKVNNLAHEIARQTVLEEETRVWHSDFPDWMYCLDTGVDRF